MQDISSLIELYANNKISLETFFIELESSGNLDNNKIIECCNKNISTLNSFFSNAKLLAVFTEYTMYNCILYSFQPSKTLFLIIITGFLFLTYKRNFTILADVILNLFFNKEYRNLQRLINLKTTVTAQLGETSHSPKKINNFTKFFSLNIQSRIFYYLWKTRTVFPPFTNQKQKVFYYLTTLGVGALLDIMLLLRYEFKKNSIIAYRKDFISSLNPKIQKIIILLLRINYSPEEIDFLINLPAKNSLTLQSYYPDKFAQFKKLKNLDHQDRINLFFHSPFDIKSSNENQVFCQFYGGEMLGKSWVTDSFFLGTYPGLDYFCSRYNFTYKGILDDDTAWFMSKNNIAIFVSRR